MVNFSINTKYIIIYHQCWFKNKRGFEWKIIKNEQSKFVQFMKKKDFYVQFKCKIIYYPLLSHQFNI